MSALERVRRLAASYDPPTFEGVPNPDAALFLSAIDHRTGYRGTHPVAGAGPYEGSALLWALGLRAEAVGPGTLSASDLADVDEERVAKLFRIDGETVAGPDVRARLWRDLARGLQQRYRGSADALLEASGGRLGGRGGLIALLARFEGFSDPLQKKSYLFAKIAERRGWLAVADPENWQVCADNVLMRLALRSGLVQTGPEAEVRVATRQAFRRVAEETGVSPPVLDDLLWELGREDADLLGAGEDVREPPRPEGTHWY